MKRIIKKKVESRQQLSAGAIVLNPQGKILIMYQTSNSYWEFPKGKQEPGETIRETLCRELNEETGIVNFEIDPGFKEEIFYKFWLDEKTLVNKKVIYYLLRTAELVRLSAEHFEYKWVTIRAAKKYLRHKNQIALLKKLNNYLNCPLCPASGKLKK